MKPTLLITLLLLLSAFPIPCINHMDIMTTITGEFPGCVMGWSLASLDFNGDGFKDLVAMSPGWNPTGSYINQIWYGKLDLYLGGPGFNNVPDYSWEGAYNRQYSYRIFNGGDINNDGNEDLVIHTYHRVVLPDSNDVMSIYIFYGREIPQAEPDYSLNFEYGATFSIYVDAIGDVNHDEYDDLAITIRTNSRTNNQINVMLGNSFEQIPFISNISNDFLYLTGIRDVNQDGIDDFHLYYPMTTSVSGNNKLVVYFGGSDFPACDSLTICENTNSLISFEACPLGDVNGDGINDFISYMNTTGKVWFGSENLTSSWDEALSPAYFSNGGLPPAVVHGDFNNDGFSDVIGSLYWHDFWDGVACLWLGQQQFNGTMDLELTSPQLGQQFGWSKAAGDFNGDGFCDVALSSPCWQSETPLTLGSIYVYSGNAQLQDTTVPNEDDLNPTPIFNLWEVDIHPNPLKLGKVDLQVNLIGEGYKSLAEARLSISNIKGQQCYSQSLNALELQAGYWHKSNLRLGQGIYLITLKSGNKTLVIRKRTIVR